MNEKNGQYGAQFPHEHTTDRELLEAIYRQNADILRFLGEAAHTLQQFQSGGMGKMVMGMLGGR